MLDMVGYSLLVRRVEPFLSVQSSVAGQQEMAPSIKSRLCAVLRTHAALVAFPGPGFARVLDMLPEHARCAPIRKPHRFGCMTDRERKGFYPSKVSIMPMRP